MELTDLQTVDKLQENEARVKMLTEEWATKWKETQKIMKERTLALRSEGMGVVLDSDLPHLIGVDDDLLSTGLKLYHIKEGNTTIGHQDADHPCDIVLFGADVQDKHCWLSNKGGIVSLHPIEEAVCSVNGTQVRAPLQLTQGCIVGIGETNLLRFNHPEEAKRLRRELKSKSMNDLSMYRSTENLLAATLRYSGAGMERKHKEEWDKLELKRIEIQKLEEKFKVAESHRQEFQKKGESDLEAQQQQIEQMRQQWQQAQHKATQAEQELEEERKKRHRQNRDILKQLEEYNREKERQCQEFQEHLEQLDRQREDSERQCREMAIALESEREQTEKRAEEERQRLAEMEQKQEKILLEREEELAEERVKLEDLLREEREKFQAELAKLEEKEAEMEENLEKAKQDLQRQQEQVQRERDEEHHFLEIEREKLEALKAKHEVARQLAKTMDDSVKAQLAMENQQVAEAWANFDKLKQRQLDTIEEAEKSIQAKAENRVAEIWQSRTELEDKKAELGRRKTENERAMKAAMSEEEKRDLRQELERIVAEEKRITTEELSLEAREADVEKDIEAEFVELEKQKRRDESILEAEWNNLLRIEAANLHYLEQELSDRKAAMEKQKQKLNSTDEHLKQFNMTRSRTLSSFTKEDAGIKDKKEQLQELLQTKECSIQDELSALEEGRAELKARKGQDSEEMGEQRRLLEEALAAKSSLLESEEELKRETAKLTHLVEQITREKQGLEELLQTESFSESRFKEEQRKLNEKMEILAWTLWCVLFWCVNTFTSMALILAFSLLHKLVDGLKHLEEQTKEKESDLIQQREEFEKERQAERALIEAERAHLQELENQERISKLVEETVKQRLLEERSERDEQLRRDQERERLERERQLEQLKRDHSQEMEELRKQIKKRWGGRIKSQQATGKSGSQFSVVFLSLPFTSTAQV
ncbi:trichohyalin-like [Acanthaster planci]|uniref:Trichohyalin-like n=1 Tax=Acanthaster planci TaxID=133434 RepID=A0A8B7Z808_ACAPL|nr:trichohyalin-like [Acanthaster planci]